MFGFILTSCFCAKAKDCSVWWKNTAIAAGVMGCKVFHGLLCVTGNTTWTRWIPQWKLTARRTNGFSGLACSSENLWNIFTSMNINSATNEQSRTTEQKDDGRHAFWHTWKTCTVHKSLAFCQNQKNVSAQRLRFLTVFLYSLYGLMAPSHNQLQCSTKTVVVSSCRAVPRIWRYVFEFPSRTGCSMLVPTAGKAESARSTSHQPALNVHGVWHTPQPQLCLCWVQYTLSDPQPVCGISSKNNLLAFFFMLTLPGSV